MENGRSSNFQHLWIVLGAAFVVLFLLRVPLLRFFILIALALGILLYGGYALWRYLARRRMEQAYRKTEEGMVAEKISYCEDQIEKQRAELAEIDHSIRELQEQMNRPDISARNLKESQRLVEAFHSEAELRRQKIGFFELCIGKLRRLLHNRELTRSIEEKREKLERLKENHYEDLATLEELKTELEMSATYLDTIETLSLRVLESTNYDDTAKLKLELEEMTRDLGTL